MYLLILMVAFLFYLNKMVLEPCLDIEDLIVLSRALSLCKVGLARWSAHPSSSHQKYCTTVSNFQILAPSHAGPQRVEAAVRALVAGLQTLSACSVRRILAGNVY